MIIRKATKRDLPIMADYSVRLLKDHKKRFSNIPKLSDSIFESYKKFLRKMMSQEGLFFVAVQENKIVGFVWGYQRKDPPIYAEEERDVGNIDSFFVEPGCRSRGTGRKLLEKVMAEFRKKGIRTINLTVQSGNTKAKRLFKSLGFKPYDERWRT